MMSFKKTTLLTFQPQNAFEILFYLGWGAVLLDPDFFQTVCPHLGDGVEDGLWLGAGGRESGFIYTRFIWVTKWESSKSYQSDEKQAFYFLKLWYMLWYFTEVIFKQSHDKIPF